MAEVAGENGVAVRAVDVTRRYGEGATAVDALRGVSLEVGHGELIAIMGPSGSGKSTLMHILAGLDKPTSGEVEIEGTRIGTLGDADLTRLRREHVGFVFQFFNLMPTMDAWENVALPLLLDGHRLSAKKDEAIAALERVGLGPRAEHRPAQLSGGEMQRVAIARALVTDPRLILADEPTGNLDSRSGSAVLTLLRRVVDEEGKTVVMVTHEQRAAEVGDRVIHLADGRIV